tara:strand:+ start:1023 stop:1253 length:231 start_codon:yes stop_codon:yes gene_type:complete
MTKITAVRLEEEIDYYLKSPTHSYSVEQIVKTLDGVEDWGLGQNLMPNKLKKKNKGGTIKSKYSQGGGVRSAKYKI